MSGVSVDHARTLVEAGVREALRVMGQSRADVSDIVDAVIGRILAKQEYERASRRRAAHERHKAKDPDGYRARNLAAVKRSRARRKGGSDA